MKLYRIKKSKIDSKGRGLYATKDIKAGTKIINYRGKILTNREVDESNKFDNTKPIYLITLNKRLTLDGDFAWNTAGGGCEFSLGCDLRIMSKAAIMTTAFARVGFSGDYGGSYFMTQLIGSAKARELYLLSDRVSAEEALDLGLVNWICEPEELMDKTMEIANRLANGPAVAYRYMKENLNRAMNGEVDDCLDLEATHHIHCGQTEDHRNATKAFVEKKEPVFKGK